jgi:hypothetical protein
MGKERDPHGGSIGHLSAEERQRIHDERRRRHAESDAASEPNNDRTDPRDPLFDAPIPEHNTLVEGDRAEQEHDDKQALANGPRVGAPVRF